MCPSLWLRLAVRHDAGQRGPTFAGKHTAP